MCVASVQTRQLKDTDEFGLIAYNDSVDELVKLKALSDVDHRFKLNQVVNALTPEYRTNLSGGVLKGIAQHTRPSPGNSQEV